MIFEYLDYKKYLLKYIESLPGKGRGFRISMAEALQCKTSFISQVLNGDQNFSIEQAFLLNSLLRHGEREGTYFLNLVQMSRAGQKGLQVHFKKEAQKVKNEALNLKNRVQAQSLKNKEDEFKYFSTADFAYTHILTTIPEYQRKEDLMAKLKVTPVYLEKILDYLMKLGFVIYKNGKYLPGPSILHVPDDASIISTHHTNWRIQAIKSCQSPQERDLHYSSIVSISEDDFMKIKTLMVQHLDEYRKIINASDCEKPYSLCFDFYEMK